MPTVNFYSKKEVKLSSFDVLGIKKKVAAKLSGSSRKLKSNEVSIRLIRVSPSSDMIGDLEVEILAHKYGERIKNSDKLATEIASYIQEKVKGYHKVRVWLELPELGHTDVEY
jgi:hypothetical protein